MSDYDRRVIVKSRGQTRGARFKAWSMSNMFGCGAVPRIQPVAVVAYDDGTMEYVTLDMVRFADTGDVQNGMSSSS